MDQAETAERVVRWPSVVSGVLCLAGIAVAAYLTYAHYTTAKVLACSDKGLINCAKVTTSSYSKVLGIPVADIGLGYFIATAAICSPWAWRSSNRLLCGSRVLAALCGVASVIWLVYVELFRLDAVCLYCTLVHAITVLLFITIAIGTATTGTLPEERIDETELDDQATTHPAPAPTRIRERHIHDSTVHGL